MANKIVGSASGNIAEVDSNNNLKANLPVTITQAGFSALASENDAGTIIGTRSMLSPETDQDYRLRTGADNLLDDETFNYTAQNTGKHQNHNTTMTFVYGTGGLLTNGTSITTTTTGVALSTYAMFPMFASGASTDVQFDASFSAQPVANTIVDIGMFLRPTSNPYAPTDGAYFRINASGVVGVINHNGTETTTAPLSFTYTNSTVYKFIIVINNNSTEFWIDDVLYGSITTPVNQGQPFMAAALPFSFRHVITGGAAGGVFQATIRGYGVSVSGPTFSRTLGEAGNAMFGSYQGLSGGTMGSLANYANSANPTAAVPTNTTAALGTGLGGQFWETASLAVNTDGIICSYQVPAGTANVLGKRLKITGINLASYIQTVIAGGPFVCQYSLAFGHTAVSLATAEAATTKAPRRVALPDFTQVVTAAQAVSTLVSQPGGADIDFEQSPIYVNPGEFVALVTKHVGTVGTSGTIAHVVKFDYSWE